eukprot:2239701-Prymnesium_polylepis.1
MLRPRPCSACNTSHCAPPYGSIQCVRHTHTRGNSMTNGIGDGSARHRHTRTARAGASEAGWMGLEVPA